MSESKTIDLLTNAVREFHWMARRYCDGRMSTAPGSFNGIVRELLDAGIDLREPLFARDGMGRSYDGLTDADALAAERDMPRGHAALERQWRERTMAMRDALEQAQSCLLGETSEDGMSHEDARADTLEKIRKALNHVAG